MREKITFEDVKDFVGFCLQALQNNSITQLGVSGLISLIASGFCNYYELGCFLKDLFGAHAIVLISFYIFGGLVNGIMWLVSKILGK